MLHTDPKLPNGGGEPIKRKYPLSSNIDMPNPEKALIDELWYDLTLISQKIEDGTFDKKQTYDAIYCLREFISTFSPEGYYIGDYVDE